MTNARARRVVFVAKLAASVALAIALAAGTIAACSSTSASSTAYNGPICPTDLPAACPTVMPSYAKEIEPIFERRCFVCHTGTGIAADAKDFSTYAGISNDRSVILDRVYACVMPPSDAGHPTDDERAALLAWLVCKAPNN